MCSRCLHTNLSLFSQCACTCSRYLLTVLFLFLRAKSVQQIPLRHPVPLHFVPMSWQEPQKIHVSFSCGTLKISCLALFFFLQQSQRSCCALSFFSWVGTTLFSPTDNGDDLSGNEQLLLLLWPLSHLSFLLQMMMGSGFQRTGSSTYSSMPTQTMQSMPMQGAFQQGGFSNMGMPMFTGSSMGGSMGELCILLIETMDIFEVSAASASVFSQWKSLRCDICHGVALLSHEYRDDSRVVRLFEACAVFVFTYAAWCHQGSCETAFSSAVCISCFNLICRASREQVVALLSAGSDRSVQWVYLCTALARQTAVHAVWWSV